jgi:hypothetical protein
MSASQKYAFARTMRVLAHYIGESQTHYSAVYINFTAALIETLPPLCPRAIALMLGFFFFHESVDSSSHALMCTGSAQLLIYFPPAQPPSALLSRLMGIGHTDLLPWLFFPDESWTRFGWIKR